MVARPRSKRRDHDNLTDLEKSLRVGERKSSAMFLPPTSKMAPSGNSYRSNGSRHSKRSSGSRRSARSSSSRGSKSSRHSRSNSRRGREYSYDQEHDRYWGDSRPDSPLKETREPRRHDGSPLRPRRADYEEKPPSNSRSGSARRTRWSYWEREPRHSRWSKDPHHSRYDEETRDQSDPSTHESSARLIDIEEVSTLSYETKRALLGAPKKETSCLYDAMMLTCAFPVMCYQSSCLGPQDPLINDYSESTEMVEDRRKYPSPRRSRARYLVRDPYP